MTTPLSRLKLVISVEVSSSSDEKPSLCSARLPFCSLACRLRVLDPPTNAKADIYNQHLCALNVHGARKTHNLLIMILAKLGNHRTYGFRSKTIVSNIPPSFSFCYPPLTPLLLVRCTIATECVKTRSHDSFICKRKRKCYN